MDCSTRYLEIIIIIQLCSYKVQGDKNCYYFVILVSYFCDGLFYQIFRNHNYYSTLFLQTVPIFLGGWKKRHHKITVKFIEKN